MIVAIIGTALKDPSKHVKQFLIGLAVLASLASILKAVSDSSDKEFMRTAVISNLIPSNPAYKQLTREIDSILDKKKFNLRTCHHSDQGMTCFITSASDPNKHQTLVFNRPEVAALYANDLERTDNTKLIEAAFNQSYNPSDLNDEFGDKVGLLGMDVFFDMYDVWPADYIYKDNGVRILFNDEGTNEEVMFTKDELAAFPIAKAPDLFYYFEQAFHKKYDQAFPNRPKKQEAAQGF